MKKLFAFFVAFAVMVPCASMGAVNVKKSAGVKKAAPVATKQVDKMESVTSLLPTVIGLVGSVKALNQQQEGLSADCAPTSSDLQLVNDLVKEWAKTGERTAKDARGSAKPCNRGTNEAAFKYQESDRKTNEGYYENFMKDADDNDDNEKCIESFSTSASEKTIWEGFPKASSAKVCEDDDGKDCDYKSNIYDVFNLISFTDEDYTKSEATKIAQFKAKAERCAPGKINAAKRELYGNFVTQTLGNIGQTSGAAGTASVMEAVSLMGGTSNVQSMLPSLGSMATQLLDK